MREKENEKKKQEADKGEKKVGEALEKLVDTWNE